MKCPLCASTEAHQHCMEWCHCRNCGHRWRAKEPVPTASVIARHLEAERLERRREHLQDMVASELLQTQYPLVHPSLIKPNGTPVPRHTALFKVGEHVVAKDQTFRVAHVNDCTLVLEPVGLPLLGGTDATDEQG